MPGVSCWSWVKVVGWSVAAGSADGRGAERGLAEALLEAPGWPRKTPGPRSPGTPPGRGHGRRAPGTARAPPGWTDPSSPGTTLAMKRSGSWLSRMPTTPNATGIARACRRPMFRWRSVRSRIASMSASNACSGVRPRRLDPRLVHARGVVLAEESLDASPRPVLATCELLEQRLNRRACSSRGLRRADPSATAAAGWDSTPATAHSRTRRSRCTGRPFDRRPASPAGPWQGRAEHRPEAAPPCSVEPSRPGGHRGARTTARTVSVSTMVANSPWRSERAIAWISSARYRILSGPTRSNVAVASEMTQVSNPEISRHSGRRRDAVVGGQADDDQRLVAGSSQLRLERGPDEAAIHALLNHPLVWVLAPPRP